jgi:serine protease Do
VALAPTRVARRLRRAVGLPERDGALVHAVETGGPADRAGIRRGDLITSVTVGAGASIAVSSVEELASALAVAAETPEQAVVLGVVRGMEELAVHVDFTKSSPASEASV